MAESDRLPMAERVARYGVEMSDAQFDAMVTTYGHALTAEEWTERQGHFAGDATDVAIDDEDVGV